MTLNERLFAAGLLAAFGLAGNRRRVGLLSNGEPDGLFRSGGYRFYFFPREEPHMHVHVHHAEGEAEFWLDPEIELALNHGLSSRRISTALALIRRHEDDIRTAWEAHFRG